MHSSRRWGHMAFLASSGLLAATAACSGIFPFDGSCSSDADCPDDAICSSDLVCVAASGETSGDGDGDPTGDGDGDGDPTGDGDGDSGCLIEVDANITEDQTWEDCEYRLKEVVYIENGATLTVAAGTLVTGESGAALIATRGARLESRGTEFDPVVFTSAQPEGMRLSGDWGGVALLGRATVNEPNAVLEGLTDEARAGYGGMDDSWSCGVLEYTRIEFAGFALDLDNELNGLTLGGCGSGTLIDHVQVHLGKDDGIEVFGGTVNLKYAVVTQADDDSLDWDRGWRGKVQFLAILQDANGDNGLECDNWKDDNDATPLSQPTIYNATVLGGGVAPRGATFKEGTAGTVNNAIFMGHAVESVDIRSCNTAMYCMDDSMLVSNSMFFDTANGHYFPTLADEMSMDDDDDCGFDEDAHFRDPVYDNQFDVDPEIMTPYDVEAPSWVPSMAVAGLGDTPPGDGFFLETATYPGAFAPGLAAWTENWTAYPQN